MELALFRGYSLINPKILKGVEFKGLEFFFEFLETKLQSETKMCVRRWPEQVIQKITILKNVTYD